MAENTSYASLVIVSLAAFFVPLLLNKLRLKLMPVVVAEIIAGIILGKTGVNLIHQDARLSILSAFGFIFLMFLSGLEIDFSIFSSKRTESRENEPNRVKVSALIFGGILLLSFGIAWLFTQFGFTKNAFFMMLIISTISLGVVVPTLKEEKISQTGIGQIILLIAVIADLVTMILLTVFVSFQAGENSKMWLLLLLFLAGVILYFVAKFASRHSVVKDLSKGTVQLDTRAIFTLIIVLVGVSEKVGAENILGAFLAGVLVSLLSPNKLMVQKLDSFGYGFLIPIFFVMVGVELDIRSLFADPKVLILIPLLLIGLLVSKLPVLYLKKWYDWHTVSASGFLLTSTLSLVIAAAKIGERIKVIDSKTSSALILTAVISCIITPVLFKKMIPHKKGEERKKSRLSIIGANQYTLPLVTLLDHDQYEISIFHKKEEEKDRDQLKSYNIIEVERYDCTHLLKHKTFQADIILAATGSDETNRLISLQAKKEGVNRVIARIENTELRDALTNEGIEVYSIYFSSQVLLRTLIADPSVVDLLTAKDHALHEVKMENKAYHRTVLRQFPFLGDVIIVRIYRGSNSIVPHGDTELLLGDRLIVTGSGTYLKQLREALRSTY